MAVYQELFVIISIGFLKQTYQTVIQTMKGIKYLIGSMICAILFIYCLSNIEKYHLLLPMIFGLLSIIGVLLYRIRQREE